MEEEEVKPEDVLKLDKGEIDSIIKDYFDDEAWMQTTEVEKEAHRQEFIAFILDPNQYKFSPPKFVLHARKRTEKNSEINSKESTKKADCAKQIFPTPSPKSEKIIVNGENKDKFPPPKFVLNARKLTEKNSEINSKESTKKADCAKQIFPTPSPKSEKIIVNGENKDKFPPPKFVLHARKRTEKNSEINSKESTKKADCAKQIFPTPSPKSEKIIVNGENKDKFPPPKFVLNARKRTEKNSEINSKESTKNKADGANQIFPIPSPKSEKNIVNGENKDKFPPPKFALNAKNKLKESPKKDDGTNQIFHILSQKPEKMLIVNGENKENQPGLDGIKRDPSKEDKVIGDNKRKLSEINNSSDKSKDPEFKVPNKLPPKKYPKRETATSVNYFEEEEPSDDRYIYCDNCNQDVVDYCKKCGMLVCVKDVKVPMGTPNRARKTTPNMFEIRESFIHGYGVFAAKNVPKGLQLGPYEGRVTKIHSESGKGYSWKLKGGKLVDAADEKFSNWMRFVNCSRNASEQNVVAFQYKGGLYYRTVVDLQKGHELLVNYGQEYCRILNIDVKNYFGNLKKEDREEVPKKVVSNKEFFNPNTETPKEYYLCKFCRIGLSSQEFRDSHQSRCQFGKPKIEVKETFDCRYCNVLTLAVRDRDRHEVFCKKNPNNIKDKNKNGKQSYQCDDCGRKYSSKLGLKYHLESAHNEGNIKMNKCSFCEYKTIRQSNLKTHTKIHDECFGFVCICCQKLFKRKEYIDNHYVSKHQDQIDKWKKTITRKINHCPKCSYQTVGTSNFKNHVLIHETDVEKKFKYHCGICGYKCIQKCNFKEHLNLHTDRLKYVCNLCNKKFNLKQKLDGHILSYHRDNQQLMQSITNKIHKCDNCSYQSMYINDLKSHKKNCEPRRSFKEPLLA